jgi:hypothetical protein
LLLLPGHLVEDLVDRLPAEYRVGHVPVGFHAENGLAQHVALDVCIVRTVARNDTVEFFFEASPAAFHECIEDPGVIFRPHSLRSRYRWQILDQRQQPDCQGIGGRIHERVEKPGDLFLFRLPLSRRSSM